MLDHDEVSPRRDALLQLLDHVLLDQVVLARFQPLSAGAEELEVALTGPSTGQSVHDGHEIFEAQSFTGRRQRVIRHWGQALEYGQRNLLGDGGLLLHQVPAQGVEQETVVVDGKELVFVQGLGGIVQLAFSGKERHI